MNENLFKTRSVLANMKTTINTLLQHYPTLFYKTLIPYLVAAMALTTLLFNGTNAVVNFYSGDDPSLLQVLLSLVALPLALLLPAVAMGIVFGKLHQQPRARCIKRNLVAALAFALLALVLYLLIDVAQQGVQTLWPSLIQENDLNDTQNIEIIKYTLTFILLLPFCPLNFAFTKYIITPTLPLRKTLKEACTTGLHNWGYLVSNQAAICFLCGVAYYLISMPVKIVLNAYYLNAVGMLQGDANGLPAHFVPMMFAVCTLIGLLLFQLLNVYATFEYFMYGAAEQRTLEKQQQQHLR